EASEESLDLEFAVGEGQTPRTRESDRAGYLENFSVRTGNCSEEFTNSAKCRTGGRTMVRAAQKGATTKVLEHSAGVEHAIRLAAVGIECLIKIDPEDARQIRRGGSQRQEQNDGPDRSFGDPPACSRPERRRKRCND